MPSFSVSKRGRKLSLTDLISIKQATSVTVSMIWRERNIRPSTTRLSSMRENTETPLFSFICRRPTLVSLAYRKIRRVLTLIVTAITAYSQRTAVTSVTSRTSR